jgi:predicted small lipoprotein YifL
MQCLTKTLITGLVFFLLGGCGQKGPLILPESESISRKPTPVTLHPATGKEHYVAIQLQK